MLKKWNDYFVMFSYVSYFRIENICKGLDNLSRFSEFIIILCKNLDTFFD